MKRSNAPTTKNEAGNAPRDGKRKPAATCSRDRALSMGGALRFSVSDWFAWTPERETRAAWRQWSGITASETDSAPLPVLPMMVRRRTTPIGQKIIGAALACGDAAKVSRVVLASRHGELSRTVGILGELAAAELPSPAEFSMAVHHGLTGLLSIHAGNRCGHTALAAGPDTFGFGLLEAAACLAERPDEPVLFLYGDDAMPAEFAPFADSDAEQPIAVALALGSDGAGIDMQVTPHGGSRQPQGSAALCFLHFLLSGAPSGIAAGARATWAWQRHA